MHYLYSDIETWPGHPEEGYYLTHLLNVWHLVQYLSLERSQ